MRRDVADEAQVAAMVERTVGEFGRLDAAYNNAGTQVPVSGWRRGREFEAGGPRILHEAQLEMLGGVLSNSLSLKAETKKTSVAKALSGSSAWARKRLARSPVADIGLAVAGEDIGAGGAQAVRRADVRGPVEGEGQYPQGLAAVDDLARGSAAVLRERLKSGSRLSARCVNNNGQQVSALERRQAPTARRGRISG